MANNLTVNSPFPVRLWAYLQERFPPVGHGVLIVSYYSCNQFLAQALTHPGEQMRYSLSSLVGAATLLAIFFHLRVFDEHKDYAEDCRHYPDRVLQSGLITLRDLKVLGGVAIGWELSAALVWAIFVSPAALVAVAAVLIFSLLMLKEFFVGSWLRKHFLLYATSHMLIMPLLAMVVYSYTTNRYLWEASQWYWFYAFVGFFVTFNWEISRKIRAGRRTRRSRHLYKDLWHLRRGLRSTAGARDRYRNGCRGRIPPGSSLVVLRRASRTIRSVSAGVLSIPFPHLDEDRPSYGDVCRHVHHRI